MVWSTVVRPSDWKPAFDDSEIQAYLHEVAGDEGLALFKFILDHEPITGEEILEAHKDQVASHVRRRLYAMMMAHALEYHNDTDSKGWETYTWRTDLPELGLIHNRRWQEEALELRKQRKIIQDHEFYACNDDHERIMFEDAMDMDFHCPACNEAMEPVDQSDRLKQIEERLDALAPAIRS